jgi:PAT family beta-lactamase induction signal transducer AmpG
MYLRLSRLGSNCSTSRCPVTRSFVQFDAATFLQFTQKRQLSKTPAKKVVKTEIMKKTSSTPHPSIWMILYFPFGALGGYVGVALTFMATKSGLSITEASLLIASQMLINWLKWLWAPAVDMTLSPKRWYMISTVLSAVGVFAMSIVPLRQDTLLLLLVVVAGANLINSVVGMSVESMMTSLTPKDQVGRVSSWFQAGNLGGAGLGGALGLYLLEHVSQSWISGAVMGVLFLFCCFALLPIPKIPSHKSAGGAIAAVKKVTHDFWISLKAPIGLLTAFLCFLPVSTGSAQGTLAQSAVAAFWKAGATEVELVQGLLSGLITTAGCFVGGWICNKINSRIAYSIFGIFLALVAIGMALSPATTIMYIAWNIVYAFGVGLSYAAFTAMVLIAIDKGTAATGYNVYASLSNFPIWWMGLLLAFVAEKTNPRMMLWTEAGLGIIGVIAFLAVERNFRKRNSRK